MASQSSEANSIPTGSLKPSSTWGEFNNITFLVQQALSKMQTATLVRVTSCTNSGGLSAVGFVDVVPLVNQIDGKGNQTPHGTIHNVPYLRVQGGGNGIILDPQSGDIGVCVFASRDITKVKSTKSAANPGSFRQYSFSDGLYLGGMLNGTPSQYVRFGGDGITIHSPTAVTIEAPVVSINASTSCTITTPTFTVNGNTVLNGALSQGLGDAGGACSMLGPVTVSGDVAANGTSVHNHKHGGVQTGSGQTGVPI